LHVLAHTVKDTDYAAAAMRPLVELRPPVDRPPAYLVVSVEVGDEVREREDERAEAEQDDAGGDPARLVAAAADVADRDETDDRRHVVAARHEARLLARQVEAPLDRRYHHAHEPVHHHSLQRQHAASSRTAVRLVHARHSSNKLLQYW